MADLGDFVATAYGPPWTGIQGTGTTATGHRLKAGDYVVAVDPNVIPLHTRVRLSHNPFHDAKLIFTALDTGGAIKGHRIDVFDWRGRRTQLAFGRRTVNVHSVSLQVGAPVKHHFPSWCPVSRGGYVQGVSGPVGQGIWELERIIGRSHVHDDYATHGHATHSFHYCGLAVDLDPFRWIWDILYPWRHIIIELFGPWGLYHLGAQFHNSALQEAHRTHIHVAIDLTAVEVANAVRNVAPTHTPVPTPPPPQAPPASHVPPYRPARPDDAWALLRGRLTDVWPQVGHNARTRGDSLIDAIT